MKPFVNRTMMLAAVLLLCCGKASLATTYVSPAGNDANTGLSWNQAKKTVQAGLNAAASGDKVWVAAGTYTENVTHKRGIALYGGFAGMETDVSQRNPAVNVTIIDGGNAGKVVNFQTSSPNTTILDGFTLRNGAGAGLFITTGSPIINNCVITGNRLIGAQLGNGNAALTHCQINANLGIGVYVNGGSPTITDDVINNNSTSDGGGIFLMSGNTPTIAHNTISGNSATHYGGGIYSALTSLAVTDCIITGNSSALGGGGVYGNNLTLLRCSVDGNSAASGTSGAGIWAENGITLTECSVNSNGISQEGGQGVGMVVNSGSAVVTNCTVNGNSSFGGTCKGILMQSGDLTLTDSSVSNYGNSLKIINGAYTITRSAFGGTASAPNNSGVNAAGGGTGLIQNCTFFNTGIYAGGSGALIISDCQMNSTNTPNQGLPEQIQLRSSGAVQVLRCALTNGNSGVFSDGTGTVSVDHCSVMGQSYVGLFVSNASALTVKDCTLSGNTAVYGALRAQVGRLTVLRNIFSDNYGKQDGGEGGGITSYSLGTSSFALIEDNLFVRNGSYAKTGGVWCQGYGQITNNTFADNTADSIFRAGALFVQSAADNSITVANNIIAFNTAGIQRGGSFAVQLSHNCVSTNTYGNYMNLSAGATDIHDDPLLIDIDNPDRTQRDFRLTLESPCRNSGDNAFVSAGDTDLDGKPRIRNSIVDIGAYEILAPPTLSGTVNLIGCTHPGGINITFTLRPVGGGQNVTRTVPLGETGEFTLPDIPARVYTLHIQGTKWLAKNLTVDASEGDVANITAQLRGGDANNDNFVDISDLLILIGAYNKTLPDSAYMDAADFTCDGSDDIFDLLLLISNYNQQGDP